MPHGPGTYGSKKGRPPKKKRVMGYKSGGLKKKTQSKRKKQVKWLMNP